MLRPGVDVPDAPPLAARGRYQRENLALALVACELLLGASFDRPRALAAAARRGRARAGSRRSAADPLVLVDGAHNPHGARALAAELPAAVGDRRPLVGVIAILADKDVDGVLDALAPRCRPRSRPQSASPRALPAADLAARIAARGVPRRPSCRRRRPSRGPASRPGRRAPSSSAGRCRCSRSWLRCWSRPRRRASMARKAGGLGVVAFALAIILTVVLLSYAVGYLIGRILL